MTVKPSRHSNIWASVFLECQLQFHFPGAPLQYLIEPIGLGRRSATLSALAGKTCFLSTSPRPTCGSKTTCTSHTPATQITDTTEMPRTSDIHSATPSDTETRTRDFNSRNALDGGEISAALMSITMMPHRSYQD